MFPMLSTRLILAECAPQSVDIMEQRCTRKRSLCCQPKGKEIQYKHSGSYAIGGQYETGDYAWPGSMGA